MEKLQRLKDLYEDGYLTEDEYSRRKNEIIDSMLGGDDDDGAGARAPRATQEMEEPITEKYVPSKQPVHVPQRTAPAGGRVVVASGPPPTGRVVYVDVNAPRTLANTNPNPVQVDKDGRMICFRCGEPIKTKVCEYERKPYDSVCVRIVQVGTDDLKMPNTSIAEPAPVRSYRNRQGERELAAIAKKNAEYEKKHNKLANKNKAQLEKAKAERKKQLEREKAKGK